MGWETLVHKLLTPPQCYCCLPPCIYHFQVAASPPMPLGAPVMQSMVGAPVIAAMSRLPVAAPPPPPVSVAGFGMPPGGMGIPHHQPHMMRQPYAAAGKDNKPATRFEPPPPNWEATRCPNLSRRNKPPWISRALEVYGSTCQQSCARERDCACGTSEKDPPFQNSLCTYISRLCAVMNHVHQVSTLCLTTPLTTQPLQVSCIIHIMLIRALLLLFPLQTRRRKFCGISGQAG